MEQGLAAWLYNHTSQHNGTLFVSCHIAMYRTTITVSDLFGILVGQPVIALLLWSTFRSRKRDVLNINLAFFHSLQYLVCFVDFCLMFFDTAQHVKTVMFLNVYVLIGGPMTLSFVCLERYVAVVHPTSYPLLKTHRCREACALSVWLVALPTATVKAFSIRLRTRAKSEVIDVVTHTVLLLLAAVIVWCNVAILRALKRLGPGGDKLHPAKKRAFRTVRAISVIAALCYIPVGVLSYYKTIQGYASTCIVVPLSILLVSVASVTHPIFYLATTGNLFSCQSRRQTK